ncbi:TlpA disulfide reductase family protein [Colwellia chukchiensis]|nr:TlpA disulfide reductase family protein [Colwellia chukchiensis]
MIVSLSCCQLSANNNDSALATLSQQLNQAHGQVVYIDFWASWCIPCRQSFPWLNKMQAQYQPHGFKVLSINLDHSRALADEFLKQIPANFPVIYDPKGEIARKYQLKGMPSSFIVNRQGEIVSAHVGFNAEKQQSYEQEISALLTPAAANN